MSNYPDFNIVEAVCKFSMQAYEEADHIDRAVEGMNRLHSLESWDRGFESHSRHGFMLFCV
jgi:hypothetical protein